MFILRMVSLSVITDKSQKEEATEVTCTFNLVRAIRVRRLQWLGHTYPEVGRGQIVIQGRAAYICAYVCVYARLEIQYEYQ